MTDATSPIRGPLRKRESNLWAREANDHYVEPAFVWDRLFQTRSFRPGMTVLDPACGFGTAVEAAARADMHAVGSDIVARWEQHSIVEQRRGAYRVANFLHGPWRWQPTDVVASNPPFKNAEMFAELALERAVSVVALLLPANWVQGVKRSRWLSTTPLHKVYFICPRPSMPPGHVIAAGQRPGNGTTDYAVFVWLKGYDGPPLVDWLYRDDKPQAA